MKQISFLLILALMAACAPKKETPKQIQSYSIEQFYKNASIGGGSFSPDESKLLLTSNQSGIYNIWEYPVDGSEPKQLTYFKDRSVFGIGYFPEDERFLFSSDNNGDEINHIFMKEDTVITDLTPWEGAKSSFYGWARDQKSFFFTSNKRDKRFFDLYEMELANMEASLIYQNENGYSIGSISKNKQFVALIQTITTSNSEMYLYDRETKETKHVSAHEGDANFRPQFFDLKNENLYFLTDEGGEFTYLSKYNLASGEKEKVWETEWDVQYAYESYNSKYRIIGVNEDAKTKVYVFDLATGGTVEMPAFEDGDVTSVSVSKSEGLVKMSVGASTSPSNIYVYNFESKKLNKLTNTLNPEINEEDLVAGKVIRYKSFDGLEIPAILYKPHQAAGDVKVPALVWVHGGPGGQSRVSYFSLIQYLVNHGYAIIAVNNRGSSGYGKTFFKMDNQKHGDVDLKDCVYAKKYLQETGWVDENKIGIIGGSYGGYMVMAALCFAPEEFDVGVNIFGVTNWLRTLKSIPPYWESFRKALYDELGDPTTADSVRLYNISPVFHADKVTKPLMVLQGANDPRVLQVESDEIVEAVKANGVPVEYVLFPDEGHGFVKKENEIKGYGQVLTFLNQYLK